MGSELLQTKPETLEDTGLPRESPFEFEQCQIQSSLLQKKGDAFNDELSRKYPYYDKTYQTQPGRDGGNPFASKRNEEDAVPTQAMPEAAPHSPTRSKKDEAWMKEMGVKTGIVHSDPDFLPPREDLRDYGSEELKKERFEENADPDIPKESSLLVRSFNHTENKKQASRLVAKVASLEGLVASSNIKVHDQHLMVNIPRGKAASIDFTASKIASIENDISKALQVRAKYSHFMTSSSFDGISLEFLLV